MASEKEYPIQNIWLWREAIIAAVPLTIIVVTCLVIVFATGPIHGEAVFMLVLAFVLSIIFIGAALTANPLVNRLKRKNFHYSFDDMFVTLHQGIVQKQNRNVPYGRIQGIYMRQTLLDRIFGLASVTFEDYSDGGRSMMDPNGYVKGAKNSRYETMGFIGNRIHIPGLKKTDAESVKQILMQKIREHPIEDSQSGL